MNDRMGSTVDRRRLNAFRALSSEARYEIIRTLAGDRSAHACRELIDQLGITPPAVSSHLRVLEHADLIRVERRRGQVYVSLATSDLAYQMAAIVRQAAAPPTP